MIIDSTTNLRTLELVMRLLDRKNLVVSTRNPTPGIVRWGMTIETALRNLMLAQDSRSAANLHVSGLPGTGKTTILGYLEQVVPDLIAIDSDPLFMLACAVDNKCVPTTIIGAFESTHKHLWAMTSREKINLINSVFYLSWEFVDVMCGLQLFTPKYLVLTQPEYRDYFERLTTRNALQSSERTKHLPLSPGDYDAAYFKWISTAKSAGISTIILRY